MNFNEYVEFNNFLNDVDYDTFKLAAESANFVDEDYIIKMFILFEENPSKFLVRNKEGIIFDYLYNVFSK